jgi:hypothetical protein
MKLRISNYSSLTPFDGKIQGFVIQREKELLSSKHEGKMPQEACLIVGGEPVGSEFVSVAWGTSESAAQGTVGDFVSFCLGGSAISAG